MGEEHDGQGAGDKNEPQGDAEIQARSSSVAVFYRDTHIGDIGYTVRVEEYEGRFHWTGHAETSRTLVGVELLEEAKSRQDIIERAFGHGRDSVIEMIRAEQAVKMLEAVDQIDGRPPQGFALRCSSGQAHCSDCDQCRKRDEVFSRRKRPGCACPLVNYLGEASARVLEIEEYSTALEQVDGRDLIRIVAPGDQSLGDLEEQISWQHAKQLTEPLRTGLLQPRGAEQTAGLSVDGLATNARMHASHLTKMRELLRSAEQLQKDISEYQQGIVLGADTVETQAALEMASVSARHTEEWLARAVPSGIRSAVRRGERVNAPMESAAIALAKIGMSQPEIVRTLGVDAKSIRRYLEPIKEREAELNPDARTATEAWRSKRRLSF